MERGLPFLLGNRRTHKSDLAWYLHSISCLDSYRFLGGTCSVNLDLFCFNYY